METEGITVGLLNWRRPENVDKIIQALIQQTVRPKIFLWDNAGLPLPEYSLSIEFVDWYVRSSRNCLCPPRWWMLAHAETPYVMTLDDDVMPTDDAVLADAIRVLTIMPDRTVIGPFGTILTGPEYFPHADVHLPAADTRVDLIKGRSMILRRDDLRTVVTLGDLSGEVGAEEDIAVCGALAGGQRGRHLVPACFCSRFAELPAGDEALEKRPDHARRRNAARRYWFR